MIYEVKLININILLFLKNLILISVKQNHTILHFLLLLRFIRLNFVSLLFN